MAAPSDRQNTTSDSRLVLGAWVGAIFLLILHLHFWVDPGPELWFGWLPVDLAYRIAWLFLAWLYLMFFCTYVWKKDD